MGRMVGFLDPYQDGAFLDSGLFLEAVSLYMGPAVHVSICSAFWLGFRIYGGGFLLSLSAV